MNQSRNLRHICYIYDIIHHIYHIYDVVNVVNALHVVNKIFGAFTQPWSGFDSFSKIIHYSLHKIEGLRSLSGPSSSERDLFYTL